MAPGGVDGQGEELATPSGLDWRQDAEIPSTAPVGSLSTAQLWRFPTHIQGLGGSIVCPEEPHGLASLAGNH